MTNLTRPYARYTCHRATGRVKFGFAELPAKWRVGSRHFRVPLAPFSSNFSTIMNLFWISTGLREFWEKRLF